MENQDDNRKKIITVSVIGFAVLIVAIILFSLIVLVPRIGKVEVYVRYAPFIAEVTLNGEAVKNNEKTYLEKGDYELKVSLEGFETLEKIVTIDDDTKTLFGSITANTSEGEKIANDKINDYAVIQSLVGAELSKEGEKNMKEWPIIRKLPVTNSLYRLGYIIENNEITLTIAAYAAYMNMAVDKMREVASAAKSELEDYSIIFKDYNAELASKFINNVESSPINYIKNGFVGMEGFNFIVGEQNGEYYCAKISVGLKEHYNLVHHRLILKKNGESWSLVSAVSPILTIYSAENVPKEVIVSANEL